MKPARKTLRVLVAVLVVLAAAHLLFVGWFGFRLVELKKHNPAVTAIMHVRGDEKPLDEAGFLPLVQTPPFVRELVILAEDSRFVRHHGIDFSSILFALRLNAGKGRIVYGGSTITQQLVRSLFLWPGKSYLRKYEEILLAVEAELLLGKDRILELYLDCAEWGPGIYGIRRAAHFYYGRDVAELTHNQLIRLVTILPAPRRVAPAAADKDPVLAPRYQAIVDNAKRLEDSPPVFSSTLEEVP